MTDLRGSVGGGLAASPFWVMAKPMGPRCNLDCTYCYYLKKVELYPQENRFRMPPDVLETFIRDYIASQARAGLREIQFVWQGGEPTMLGLELLPDHNRIAAQALSTRPRHPQRASDERHPSR